MNTSPGSDDDGWIVPPPVTLSCGTRVQLYKDGESLHAAFEAIKHAKRRICLEIYIFADDPTGRAFADLLCAKAKEGVKVFLIYDSFGSIATNHDMFLQMRAAGVRASKNSTRSAPGEGRYSWRFSVNRDHRKLLLIDNDIAGMGGLNIGAEYAGSWVVPSSKPSCVAWRDTAVGFVGPSARYFLQSFTQTWHYVMQGGRIGKAGFIHGLNVSKKNHNSPPPAELGILASVATMDSPLRAGLHRLFSEAKKSIQLTMAYFAPDDDLINTLCRAAQRGVKVQLMLPAQCDVQLLLIAARSFYAKLLCTPWRAKSYERQGLHHSTPKP